MSNIILYVLGEYSKLKIYISTIEGPLLRREPNDNYYKAWKVINNGSSTSSTKSGSQTLMAQFIVLSMLMRQHADDCSWLFLVSDNPFGTMSAPELVEAVFSMLELLKIQWLVVGPPITDVNITSMFNTVYQMDVLPDNNGSKLIKLLEKKIGSFCSISIFSNQNKTKFNSFIFFANSLTKIRESISATSPNIKYEISIVHHIRNTMLSYKDKSGIVNGL